MNSLHIEENMGETFTVVSGYDTGKKPVPIIVRKFTLEDIKAMGNDTTSHYKSLDRSGKLRDIRSNGKLKTWKKDPSRFERSFKYGMFEHFRLNTQGMLDSLVIVVENKVGKNYDK